MRTKRLWKFVMKSETSVFINDHIERVFNFLDGLDNGVFESLVDKDRVNRLLSSFALVAQEYEIQQAAGFYQAEQGNISLLGAFLGKHSGAQAVDHPILG